MPEHQQYITYSSRLKRENEEPDKYGSCPKVLTFQQSKFSRAKAPLG